MKRIATIVENGRVVGLVHGADEPDQSIVVNGRKWRFDFDRMFGPLWLKSNGTTERKCQNPSRSVWAEFEKWHRAWLKNNPEHKPDRKRAPLKIK